MAKLVELAVASVKPTRGEREEPGLLGVPPTIADVETGAAGTKVTTNDGCSGGIGGAAAAKQMRKENEIIKTSSWGGEFAHSTFPSYSCLIIQFNNVFSPLIHFNNGGPAPTHLIHQELQKYGQQIQFQE